MQIVCRSNDIGSLAVELKRSVKYREDRLVRILIMNRNIIEKEGISKEFKFFLLVMIGLNLMNELKCFPAK